MKITNVKILVRTSSMKICDLIIHLLLSILLKVRTLILIVLYGKVIDF